MNWQSAVIGEGDEIVDVISLISLRLVVSSQDIETKYEEKDFIIVKRYIFLFNNSRTYIYNNLLILTHIHRSYGHPGLYIFH